MIESQNPKADAKCLNHTLFCKAASKLQMPADCQPAKSKTSSGMLIERRLQSTTAVRAAVPPQESHSWACRSPLTARRGCPSRRGCPHPAAAWPTRGSRASGLRKNDNELDQRVCAAQQNEKSAPIVSRRHIRRSLGQRVVHVRVACDNAAECITSLGSASSQSFRMTTCPRPAAAWQARGSHASGLHTGRKLS